MEKQDNTRQRDYERDRENTKPRHRQEYEDDEDVEVDTTSRSRDYYDDEDDNEEYRPKKRRKRRKKQKSSVMKVISKRNRRNTPIPLFIIEFIFAFILDVLKVLRNLILGFFVILIICGVIACSIVWSKVKPYYEEYNTFAERAVNSIDEHTFRPEESTFIYDANGDILIKMRGNQDSDYLEYRDIPAYAVDAYVAVEDRSFWENPGIDIKGLIRVARDAVQTRGDEIHGASTITQQLARNIFLTHEVSIERKGKEMLIAMKLTKKYTKQEIMEFYVNNICYANALYGLEAASKAYFNKPSSELTLSQICYLCAIPNSPEYYNPYKNPERALERRDKILGDMRELELITEREYQEALDEEIHIEKPEYEFSDYLSTFAVDCATRYFMNEEGFNFRYTFESMTDYNNYKKDYNEAFESAKYKLSTGGYRVHTTLDPNVQAELQQILDEQLAFDEELNEETGIYALQGAVTAIDNYTGKVIAVVGGRSQEGKDDNVYSLNRAYQSTRQPGSSIKPLVVYTPALMNGYTPNTTVFNIDVSKAKEKGVDVQSLSGQAMTLRSALEQSKNGVSWQIFDKLGANEALSYINTMKFASICPDDYFNSASLGGLTYGVTTVEMASAYSTLANHGYYREPTCITKILNSTGDDIFRDTEEVSVYSELAADTMINMMKGVLTNGTASKLGWYKSTDMVAACKTGTTNDSKDGWLCGVTPYYSVAVWVGYDQPRTLDNLWGSTYPAQIWKNCMLKLIEGNEIIEEFEYSEEFLESGPGMVTEADENAEYMPGRASDEELSPGYFVYNYRDDHALGEQVNAIIDQMYSKDKSNPSYKLILDQLLAQGHALSDQIYSISYKAEVERQLDWVYMALIQEAQGAQ